MILSISCFVSVFRSLRLKEDWSYPIYNKSSTVSAEVAVEELLGQRRPAHLIQDGGRAGGVMEVDGDDGRRRWHQVVGHGGLS